METEQVVDSSVKPACIKEVPVSHLLDGFEPVPMKTVPRPRVIRQAEAPSISQAKKKTVETNKSQYLNPTPAPAVTFNPQDTSGITTQLMTITPQMARQMLGHNENNRNVSKQRVNQLATEMKRGAWRVNGDSIRFSVPGRLLDGQHRLLACIQANVPFQTFVVRGLPDKVQETMDTGKPRTMGNIMQIRGESDTVRVASVLRAVYLTEQLGLEAGASNNITPSRIEQLEFFDQTPQIRDLTQAGVSFYRASNKLLSPAMYACLYWTLSKISMDDADEFFSKLETGADLEKGSPILALRNYLISALQSRAAASAYQRRRTVAMVVKAWNKWRDGKPVQMFRFGDNEAFPEAH
ncbi:hypothetical protein [Bifidobacterium sp. SO1]|uniref:hypothetical protein n=1 Tax=Bifidobacterium sp. SO1 TaxID=2809029 RepID=UPI001BDBC6BC|nr:hypothetical protein [Bifidobacterium sp. SO1]MBT1162858.1 hypothetical protein [Bifidobacterium sp. SO1]